MKDDQVLKQVAEMVGIADHYVSAWGDEASVDSETIRRLLTALGYDTKNDEALLESAQKRLRRMCWHQ
ncbi:4-alpha-glucanotransferase [Photobacterium aphoticum]|uniref:4-alpha-glucanotransferase n=1 Tax=Photobacterium aphoticum TaxID=754436 RepID=A0A090QLI9_9GAMM|nr:4-alpha-glucanotransferase [Photobacterium aphoticum]